MISQRTIEIWVGIFVAAGAAALFMLAMQVSNLSSINTGDSYQVTADFGNVGALKVRSPVKASGVVVGRVTKIQYDDKSYEAVVTLSIERKFDKFPVDTTASIYTAGLLGEQYVGLQPGADEKYLRNGDSITITDSAMILERLIGKFMVDKMSGN